MANGFGSVISGLSREFVERIGNRGALSAVQALRGIAAVSVVFYHVYIIGGDKNYLGIPIFEFPSEYGKLGVNLFFVLSGFIICYAHFSDIGVPGRAWRYIERRVVRIYPSYWFFSIVYILAAAIGVGSPDFSWDTNNLFSAALLVDYTGELTLPLKVGWTLLYEIGFYIVFLSLVLNARFGVVVFCGWMALILASNLGYFWQNVRVLSLWNVHFLIGMAVYFLYPFVSRRVAFFVFMLGILGLVVGATSIDYALTPLDGSNRMQMLTIALSFGAIVLSGVVLDEFVRKWSPAWLSVLGDASYSIYLAHSGVISFFYIIVKKFGVTHIFHPVVLYFSAAILATLGGVFAYFIIERPFLRWARGR